MTVLIYIYTKILRIFINILRSLVYYVKKIYIIILFRMNINAGILEKVDINIKYIKYLDQYDNQQNKIFWGLGIENEIYLEFENKNKIEKKNFTKHMRRERYSVDYNTNYNSEYLNDAINDYLEKDNDDVINLPILLNSNSFTRTDMYNNSKTLYTKLCEPNPKFNGDTLIESLIKENPYFEESINKKWLFDGDTIEFNTLNFYNAKLNNMIDELENNKNEFVTNVNDTFKKLDIFSKFGKIKIMEKNHPFANHMTNLLNNTMFNNGTLHYNITLPTQLNSSGQIADFKSFTLIHSKAIKIIQWFEPFIIGLYGSPDPFSDKSVKDHNKYSKASQRCAISRYISIGTYDSDIMTKGKILACKVSDLICNDIDNWWFNNYYKQNNYNKLEEIGMDINFNKYSNHGIELRFLDHIPDSKDIFETFEFIIYLMDFIMDKSNDIQNPIVNRVWNQFALNVMIHGSTYQLKSEEKLAYEKLFNIKLNSLKLKDVYNEIYIYLITKYNIIHTTNEINVYTLIPQGEFSKLTLDLYNRYIDPAIYQKLKGDITDDSSNESLNLSWCLCTTKSKKKNKNKNKKKGKKGKNKN